MQLFSKQGEFIPMDDETIASMPSEIRDAYVNVKNAAEQSAIADADVATARKRVADATTALVESERRLRTIRPPVTAHNAIRAHLLSERAVKLAARGL